MSKMDRMLARMIGGSKGQFIAVVTIIITGIVIYVAMSINAVNMSKTVSDYYQEYGFADLFLDLTAIPEQKVAELARMPGVAGAEGRIVLDAPVITEDLTERVHVQLIAAPSNAKLNRCYLFSGKPIKEGSRQAWVLDQFAKARGLSIGDEIEIQSGGAQYKLEIVGTVANPEFIYLMENAQSIMPDPEKYGIVYISEALGQQLAGIPGAYNNVLLTYTGDVHEEELIKKLEERLDAYGFKQSIKREDQLSNNILHEELTQLERMSGSLPILFILVAALVLMMMLGRMVKRDRIKIGILKGLGYSNRSILLHYTKYSVTAGILGGLFGGILGLLLSSGMTRLYLTYFNIPLLRVGFYPQVVVSAILVAAIFCAASGLIGARGILKISPADSMQSEAPKGGKRILLEGIPFFWRRLSFTWKMVWKNVFRNKRRNFFVLAGVSITYGLMLFTTSMPGVIDDMMNKHYREFQKMDYTIGFYKPVKASAVRDFSHLVDVDYIEGKLEYPFEFQNGNKNYTVNIIGLPADTAFYTFKNVRGDEVKVPEEGVMITQNLANVIGVEKGDFVRINTFIPGKDDIEVEVKDVLKQTLGINAYMDIGYMGKVLMDQRTINGVYLNTRDPRINEELIHAGNVASVMSIADTRAVYEQFMTMMNLMIGFMVVFSGILGFCIVYNATTIAIGEREMEFASLRVLGMSKEEIFRIILNENTVTMIGGIILGIPLGIMMLRSSSAAFTTNIYTIILHPSLPALGWAAVFTALFVLIAQGMTYKKIRKLDLLQALKNRTS